MKQMNDGTLFKQRDIVLVPFPFTDFSGNKQRPALVLSNNELHKSEDFICCGITSQKQKHGIEMNERAIEEGSLPFQSWVKPTHLMTIQKKLVRKKLGTVSKQLHTNVVKELNTYLK